MGRRVARGSGLLAVLLLAACTSVPVARPASPESFGPPATIAVCLLRTPDVSAERVDDLMRGLSDEWRAYGLTIDVPWVLEWERPGFTVFDILKGLEAEVLPVECDRLFAFVGRHAGDVLWGLMSAMIPLPEVFGAVDDTFSRGYVVAHLASINHLFFGGPAEGVRHEGYHLLGCGHEGTETCHEKILAMKLTLGKRP